MESSVDNFHCAMTWQTMAIHPDISHVALLPVNRFNDKKDNDFKPI